MEFSFIRVGQIGKEHQVGFILLNDLIRVFDSLESAYDHYDYSGETYEERHSAAIHMISFSPVIYTFDNVKSEEEVLEIMRKGLASEDGRVMKAILSNVADRITIACFPGGKDPFPQARKTLKTCENMIPTL
jgi:hypothetical protein